MSLKMHTPVALIWIARNSGAAPALCKDHHLLAHTPFLTTLALTVLRSTLYTSKCCAVHFWMN